ncbi:hypothetical protein LB507_004814 [Fusarium sp. FIESC RH6]|nr:hypothetical protein LB507_004814 [Fusarium sp. FIESC RH6]
MAIGLGYLHHGSMRPQPGSTLPSSSAKGHADDVYVLLQWTFDYLFAEGINLEALHHAKLFLTPENC